MDLLLPNSSADTSPLIPLQSHIFVNSPFIKPSSNNPNLSMQVLVEILTDGGILLLAAESTLSDIPAQDSSSYNPGDIMIQEIPVSLPIPVSNGVGVSVGGGRQWLEEGGGSKGHVLMSRRKK